MGTLHGDAVVSVAAWGQAKAIIGEQRVTLGPQASQQWLEAPEHLAMVLARYRVAAALIGDAGSVLEVGCGEGIGAGILAKGRWRYAAIDPDASALEGMQERLSVGPGCLVWISATAPPDWGALFDAVVSLDVIEHIPPDDERQFMQDAIGALRPHGVMVVGTPSQYAEHLASPQSRAGHVNLYTPERLRVMMGHYFHVVQMLYMQDTSLHLGHEAMAHYLVAVGIGPRKAAT